MRSSPMNRQGDESSNELFHLGRITRRAATSLRHIACSFALGPAKSFHGQSASVSCLRQEEEEDKEKSSENATRIPGKWKLVGCIRGCEHVFRYSSLFALFRAQSQKNLARYVLVCWFLFLSFICLPVGMTLRNFFLARKQLKSFLIRSGCPVRYHWGGRRPQKR